MATPSTRPEGTTSSTADAAAVPAASSAASGTASATGRTVKAPDERRSEILAAARELFAERGINKTSISDVAARVGVTRGLVYHYVADKDSLVDAVLAEYIDEMVDRIRAWDAARETGNIEQALTDCIALFRSLAGPGADVPRIDDTRLYHRFLDRAVEAVVDCFRTTTVEAYARRHRIEIENVYETFSVLIYGLVGLIRAVPTVDDDRLVSIVRQTLRLDRAEETGAAPA
ncbi:TetR/AcrR family transcriptional regulator [Sanguibacter suarezii]|uniref:TetR/AcrR family transcriptional regulator n=1 Tax=Sanguibacter suarezii TaxID=60921 RepID=UPI0008327127|nr:TetR/AcrR family transcriptional regulator [Sanguibacter suarezii]